jgi:hypothetical protein
MINLLLSFVLLVLCGIVLFIVFIRHQKQKQLELEMPLKWFNSSLTDYFDMDENGQLSVRMGLYHFFENLWKFNTSLELPSDLLLRVFWNSSDEKLKEFVGIQRILFSSNLNPQAPTIVQNLLASIVLAELNCRVGYHSSHKWLSVDKRNTMFKKLDEICPTLQIEMWRSRFPVASQQHRLFPFLQ